VRILVADDSAVSAKVQRGLLESLGHVVEVVVNGRDAVASCLSGTFDAVLMDLTVPGGMGGQEAVMRLRAVDEKAVAIVYSGYSTDPVLAEYAAYGFDGRLSKPFRVRELAAVLEEVLGTGRQASSTSLADRG